MHWSEFIGGDVVISPPHSWQKRYNASDIKVEDRMDRPVQAAVITELTAKFADFRAAYQEGGLTAERFDSYGPTVRTLRQFIAAFAGVSAVMRDFMLPNPEVAS
jgi:transaldolase